MATEALTDLNSLLVTREGYRNGWPCLRGTGMTVHTVAARHMMGESAADLVKDFAHLDPGLIYAAMAYYYANKARVERELDEEAALYERLRKKYPNGVTAANIDPSDFD